MERFSGEGSPTIQKSNDPVRPSQINSNEAEWSVIDRQWGTLFDSQSNPTPRLNQLLRGLANYIITDFEPRKSVVITPAKMATFYITCALQGEINPLTLIFREQSNIQISQLYQDLGCQHHLVQDRLSMAPTIPALTSSGFASWMTAHILAYPEQESKRLETVVLTMPIDADEKMVDGKPERLPKQVSRHLFPKTGNRQSKKALEDAIDGCFIGTSRRRQMSWSDSLPRRPVIVATDMDQSGEDAMCGGDPLTPTIQPLERQRMPYSRAPSTGDSNGTF